MVLRSTIAACVLALCAGCGYPQVAKPTYELADVLYRVCDQRSSHQLDQFTELLQRQHAAGEVSDDERALLLGIVDVARDGDWVGAKRDVRELMLAQSHQALPAE